MKILSYVSLITSILFCSCGSGRPQTMSASSIKEAWDVSNDPSHLRAKYEVKFASLPASAELAQKPWSDSYWPDYRGGLANRWNDPAQPDSFSYKLATRQKLASMSTSELKKLSPAEKYDIFQGRLDYPLVQAERARTGADHPKWFGLCHGWAPASLNFTEPTPITVRSKLGFDIPFGSSDIKALLIYAQQTDDSGRMIGRRCEYDVTHDPSHANDPACRDANAGSFHVIVANQIGLMKQGFVADVARGDEVWNQPVFGFKSEVSSETTAIYPQAAPGTVRILTVTTTLRFIAEIGANWDPKPFDDYAQEGTKDLSYTLELNAAGEIVGGEWITFERPDFIWMQEKPSFFGYLSGIEDLYKPGLRR